MLDFSSKEKMLLKKLNNPAKMQDFLNGLKFNFENQKGHKRETLKSPILTLRAQSAHCFEGALLGAYVLSLHGYVPYIMHLKSIAGDYDHVITPFKVGGLWGALSKTNHAVLRYREPIYKNIRELAMSYFHEYFLDSGTKTLREYSAPLNLNTFKKDWITSQEDLWWLDKKLDKIKHYKIVSGAQAKKLRKADKIEVEAGKLVEFRK